MRCQEPPGATLLDDMPGIAGGALRDLKRESLGKSQEPPPQARALIGRVEQDPGRHPQPHLQRVDNGVRNLILNGKNVGQVSVVAVSPDMAAVVRVDELSGDANALSSAQQVPAPRGHLLTIDNRYLPPLLITSILVGANLSFGILEGWERTALSIVVAIGAEMVLGRITHGKWPHPASAYISGISAGILIRSPFMWPYFFTSFISILSKYVLRLRGRHVWNPTNFGVSAIVLLAPATVTVLSIQWGNAVAPMVVIWLLGAVIVWRVGRAHISATYVAAFFVFSFVRSALTGVPWLATVAPITGPMYQLFIFFMITDPKTTVRSKKWQCVVVVMVAFVEMLMRLAEVVYAPFYALFVVGSIAMVIDITRESRSSRRPS